MGFSSGKGCAATLMHVLVDRGLADYDDPVAKHWPEFAGGGKAAITIRHVLSHGAGLYRLSDMVSDFWEILDFEADGEAGRERAPGPRPRRWLGLPRHLLQLDARRAPAAYRQEARGRPAA